jgi:hypothetical protein
MKSLGGFIAAAESLNNLFATNAARCRRRLKSSVVRISFHLIPQEKKTEEPPYLR